MSSLDDILFALDAGPEWEPAKCPKCGQPAVASITVATGYTANELRNAEHYHECRKCGERIDYSSEATNP